MSQRFEQASSHDLCGKTLQSRQFSERNFRQRCFDKALHPMIFRRKINDGA
jgi:hypothetical protein